MATLDTLIKLTQKKLEGCQQRIMALDMELAALKVAEDLLARQVKDGYAVAEQVTTMAGYQDAGAFLGRAEEEQARIEARRAELHQQKEAVLAEVRDLFAEKKRYEVLLETQQIRARKKREKKEQATLEDLANR